MVQHPADVTVGPNDWAEFNCTVNCPCTENVTWHMVRRASTPMQSNSTTVCTSGRQTYFLSILATEALNNLGVYCVAYESRAHGCNPSWRHFSRPALLVGTLICYFCIHYFELKTNSNTCCHCHTFVICLF